MAPKRAIAKVIYKPSTQSTDEYTVVVNIDEFNRWKAGETTIPLTDVVDSFQVLFSNQGSQGLLRRPSDQQLENEFGTKRDVDVVQQILAKGVFKEAEGIRGDGGVASTNVAMGSGVVDTRGKRSGTGV